MQCVFISILADFFTPPEKFPGLGVFAINPETSFDKRIPKKLAKNAEEIYHYSVLGGIGTLVDALVAKIEENGGRVLTNTPVTKILIENDRVAGVIDGKGNLTPADVVIASGGVRETFFKLVDKEHLPPELASEIREVPLMDSVFMVHLGIDFDPSPHVHGVCTYYYGTYDVSGAIKRAKDGIYHEGEDGFVVHVPTLHSPEMAPPGHHAMTIYTICPDHLKDESWSERKEEYADRLLMYAEKYIPGLREHVKIREILTPEDFRARTHLDHHAFGGLAPIMDAPLARHRTPIEGLWFIGHQSESGGGLPNVIPSAYKTAKLIDEGN